jgi:hemolysin activation/secretion protein
MNSLARGLFVCVLVFGLLSADSVLSADETGPILEEVQQQLEDKAREAEKLEARREDAARAKREVQEQDKTAVGVDVPIDELELPEDTTLRFNVRHLRIIGNSLILTSELLEKMPLVYNASDKPLCEAESESLYDLTVVYDVVNDPGRQRQISIRTIQGLTQYILSVYQSYDYAGVYVYVPAGAIKDGVELYDEFLVIKVLEASVSNVGITSYDVDRNEVEEGFLKRELIEQWSPVKAGTVADKRKLNEYVNLLNLNPDRYVSAVVTKGSERESISLGYDVYEANPWHFYVQVDNSGSEQRRWSPKFGVINTNLTGRDDSLSAMYQVAVDEDLDENYAMFGSYEFPLFTQRLRLKLYSGYSKYDIDPEGAGGWNFRGHGSFTGAMLRYNILQHEGWFFDVLTSISHERSEITSLLFNSVLGSKVWMDLWGVGLNVHRLDDMSRTSFLFDRIESISGSSDSAFDDARAGADSDFNIYTVSAAHRQYLDPDKIQRMVGSVWWIHPNQRMVPARMMVFGGLYSVRGYKEHEIVADGGTLLSLQYEYDMVKHYESQSEPESVSVEKPFLRRFAPLVFFDCGRAETRHATVSENKINELASVGVGTAVELGNNFEAGIYYGWPLRSTEDTKKGHGRWNFSFILRW